MTLGLIVSTGIIAASVAACGGGGDPKIKSFQSSSTNVPLPGGDVTFTWNVKGEDTLELRPFPGVVHGTGITLNVTESTEFTLVAKGNGRSDRETLYVGVGDPISVSGRVLRPNYGVASGYSVYSQGKSAITDDTGSFELEGVVAPYDLAVFDPSSTTVILVYSGLTRLDPTIVIQSASNDFSTLVTGTVSGVPFPTPTPPPSSSTQIHGFLPDGTRNVTPVDPSTGTFTLPVSWGRSPETTGTFTTLRFLLDVNGVANSFPGYQRTTGVALEDGVPETLNPALTSVAALPLSGAVTMDTPLPSPSAWATVDYGSPEIALQSGVLLYALVDSISLPPAVVTSASLFTRFVPDVGAGYALTVGAGDVNGYITHTKRNLAGGATGVQMHLPTPPRLLLPVQGAVLTPTTQFSVSGAAGDVFVHRFTFYAGFGLYQVDVYSKDNAITFPDLEAMGLALDDVSEGQYTGGTFGPFGSIDELASANGFVTAGDDSYSGYANGSRSFSTTGGPGFP